ncbi:MAG: response regulator transcription factor [Pseudomonadota bacterium]|nr:response regulator transcription factor [Pseudomonadota bacterium]
MMLMSVGEQDSESTRSTDEETAPVSILVVDDHPVVRMGVSMLLTPESGLRVVGEASSCAEAWEMLLRLRPDVILGDLMLEDGTACDLMQKMHAEGIAGQVIVYTAHAGEAHVLEALRAGASGYIIKGSAPQRLIDAIRTVARGDSYLDPTIASQVIGRVGRTQERRSGHSRELTKREVTVLDSLTQGMCNKDIAQELFITERTVKYHVKALFNKLRVKNRTQAVRVAIEQGLISL